jgi:hypothetical protein
MHFIKLIIFISSLLLFTSESDAKKRCKSLLEKLHRIQAMQRNGYSLQRGLSLRVKEDTQSIGFNTTKSVVEAIFAVIVCDALFSITFTNLGI